MNSPRTDIKWFCNKNHYISLLISSEMKENRNLPLTGVLANSEPLKLLVSKSNWFAKSDTSCMLCFKEPSERIHFFKIYIYISVCTYSEHTNTNWCNLYQTFKLELEYLYNRISQCLVHNINITY